jgi:putative ABC transport system substrate-binding protein
MTCTSEQRAALALRRAVPAVFQDHEFPLVGGLMSYGANTSDIYRIAGTYTGRILEGERPSDLPVQQSTKIELLINLRIAKAFGLELPTSILVRADEVIE